MSHRIALAKQRPALYWIAGTLLLAWGSGRVSNVFAQPAPSDVAASAVHESLRPDDPAVDTVSLLRLARERLEAGALSTPVRSSHQQAATRQHIVFLSLSRSTQPAVLGIGEGESVAEATLSAADDLRSRATFSDLASGLLKIDVATETSESRTTANPGLVRVIPVPSGLELAAHDFLLSPDELETLNLSMLQGEVQGPSTRFYLSSGWRRPMDDVPVTADSPRQQVSYQSRMETAAGGSVELHRGDRLLQNVSAEQLLQSAIAGGDYLLRHLRLNGEFEYIYDPRTNRSIGDYNLLRHAGTCYALLELQQASDREAVRGCANAEAGQAYAEGAKRGISFLLDHHSRGPKEQDHEAGFLAIVSPGEEAKLGGAALTLLAILKYREVSGEDVWLAEMEQLAKFLVFQQEPNGYFRSKYFYGTPDHVPFDSLYYPGEAILALARLANVNPEGPWLATAKRGADWIIDVRDADKPVAELPHDHWLLMGLDELADLSHDDRYVAHAMRIAEAICDAQNQDLPNTGWLGSAYEPSVYGPTRAEALVAMARLARHHNLDDQEYIRSLQLMAALQRRCQITPENGLYLPRPDQAVGGFRSKLNDWEVRIDHVQHNISALLGIRSLMLTSDK